MELISNTEDVFSKGALCVLKLYLEYKYFNRLVILESRYKTVIITKFIKELHAGMDTNLKLENEGIKEVKRMEKITRRMISSIAFHQDLFGPNLRLLSQLNKIFTLKRDLFHIYL